MTDLQEAAPQNGVALISALDFSSAELIEREYRIPYIEQEIYLRMVAVEDNPDYAEAILSLNSSRERRQVENPIDPASPVAREIADETRESEDDRLIFPGAVVKGWRGKGLTDPETGEAIPFSVDGCGVLLQKLPRVAWNRVRTFALITKNFCRGNAPQPAPATETAGNL